MSAWNRIGSFWKSTGLAELLFPKTCPACDKALVKGEEAYCLACFHELETTGFLSRPRDNELFGRLAGRAPMEGAVAFFYYHRHSKLRAGIRSMKYYHQVRTARFFGHYMGGQLAKSEWVEKDSLLLPVPLHRKRMAERGYNQAEKIASALAERLGIQVDGKKLRRRTHTSSQTKKGKEARWENMKDAFYVKGELPEHVVLLDDVITTGATIEGCLRAVHEARPDAKVKVLSVGVTKKGA